MKNNKLKISINKPVAEVFAFTTTPPNSKFWIDSVIDEQINEFPVKKGTVYRLTIKDGTVLNVTVFDTKENEFIEWVSKDKNYHCRYKYNSVADNITELEYYEWVGKGDLDAPFEQKTMEKLKQVMEQQSKK